MSVMQTLPARSPAPHGFGARVIGFVGLGLIAILMGLSDVVARAPVQGAPLQAPSLHFMFGTDLLGRDVALEILRALAVTASDAAIAMLVALAMGGFFGFVVARLPWHLGDLLRWIAGVLGSVPALFLAILFVGLTARNLAPLAAGVAAAPATFNRAFDGARLLGRSRYTEYARASGIGSMTLLRRDLAYEILDNFLGLAARALAAVAIILSTASFFGFGAVPPERDLGLMIAAARVSYFDAWWTAAFPALALMMFILFARLAAGLEEGERP